ncbi:class I SAM-dependent RNA methyltransferase [Roseospira visakhapatnamensis]|uniref:23S rRNA (Uracil1939-C5)-methyltransferase n=1 Tax=Roseospira visakhapatnamensis TaxID=390880 RepID=A0A7W6RF51_9PROT|nr:TRAM domain-containing protein [Roseospira visakhapatnamensis]MBB4267401.1 23S rRNA (uracil1939-C5)-methyltransferase [Roseospira visakhapatnamensis]
MTARRHSPRPPRRSAAARARPTETVEVTVDALGAHGDGLAAHQGRRIILPGALPGDRVRARIGGRGPADARGALEAVVTPSPDRVPPPCPHFGSCGGCTLQHLAPDALTAWKREAIGRALGHRGLGETPVGPVIAIPPGSRRRATLGWVRTRAGLSLGFHGAASHRLEDLRGCALLAPALVALVGADGPLRPLLAALATPGTRGAVIVTETDTGLDLTLDLPAPPDLDGRERLAAFAETVDPARLGVRIGTAWEPVAARRPPQVRFAGMPVTLPPLAFLQPSPEGEAAITAAILDRLPGTATRALDLFAGLGTFSLPLAARGLSVRAVDGAGAAMAALAAAPVPAGGRVSAETRDLARDPLTAPTLADADVVVVDPPRAGARAQAEALAAAGPATVIAVSCNPATFARDARLLVDGGYRLETVTPIDQFPWSAHVEMVAALRRPA